MAHKALVGREPQVALGLFSEILKIPRPSHQEGEMIGWVTRWAESNGFTVTTDRHNNVVVRIPATTGYENMPSLAIQGHLDMVYNPQRPDVIAAPIDVEVVNGYLQTVGQSRTLGADNAAAIVLAMDAALTCLIHGVLYLVFTAAEEDDLSGAENFNPLDHGMEGCKLLINLDTPQHAAITVMAAGFQYVNAAWTPTRESIATGPHYRLTLTGLQGGHSGDNIAEDRSNSNLLMANILRRLPDDTSIVSFKGGEAKNGIPSTAEMVVEMTYGSDPQKSLSEFIETVRTSLKRPQVQLAVELIPQGQPAWTQNSHRTFLGLLGELPNGVIKLSSFGGVPELSTTIAVVEQDGEQIKVTQIVRGADEEAMQELTTQVMGIYKAHGFGTSKGHHGPGWKQLPGSPLVERTRLAFDALGQPATVQAVHCGLEMACFTPYFPTMVSFGSEVLDEHATSERLRLDSMVLCRTVLHQVLCDVAQGKVN